MRHTEVWCASGHFWRCASPAPGRQRGRSSPAAPPCRAAAEGAGWCIHTTGGSEMYMFRADLYLSIWRLEAPLPLRRSSALQAARCANPPAPASAAPPLTVRLVLPRWSSSCRRERPDRFAGRCSMPQCTCSRYTGSPQEPSCFCAALEFSGPQGGYSRFSNVTARPQQLLHKSFCSTEVHCLAAKLGQASSQLTGCQIC